MLNGPGDSRQVRSAIDDDDMDLKYKPIQMAVMKPPEGALKPCSQYIITDCKAAMPEAVMIDEQVEIASRVTKNALEDDVTKAKLASCGVTSAMALAIAMFTMDVSLVASTTLPKNTNFYFQLNKKLRTRDPLFISACHGYLYYLMTGLQRLPAYRCEFVYRGIDKNGAPRALKEYRLGRSCHWSAFSSAVPEDGLRNAINFAKSSGAGGLILRVTTLGDESRIRDIRDLSAFPDEAEVLLLTNFKTVVISKKKFDPKIGLDVIDLVEKSDEDTDVF